MKNKRILKTGERFGRLVVVQLSSIKKYTSPKGINKYTEYYLCICDCGRNKITRKESLIYNKCKSCGCLEYENKKSSETKHKTHHQTGTRLYKCWCNMKSRCYRKNDIDYKNYNKLGITVCDEWKNNSSAFMKWAKENGYSNNLTLDRIDTYKGYSPDNCRWINKAEQNRNQTSTLKIKYNNKIYCLSELSRLLQIPRTTLKRKIEKGLINAILL